MRLTLARRSHPTAYTLGMSRRRFARIYQSNPDVRGRWGAGYVEAKDAALAAVLADGPLLKALRSGASLPSGFGFALDERIIELPWVVANLDPPAGAVLDAGSALNHRVVLERVTRRVGSLTIVTFTEEDAVPELDAAYVTADLRELPFDDGSFDTSACISTLEHIGMDNSDYGSAEPPSDDPDHEMGRALVELRRVLRPGSRLLVTVPYGVPEDHGWCRQFDAAGVRAICEAFGDPDARAQVYAHSLDGWQLRSPEAAAAARYRDPKTDPRPQPDCAVAARAVACVSLVRSHP